MKNKMVGQICNKYKNCWAEIWTVGDKWMVYVSIVHDEGTVETHGTYKNVDEALAYIKSLEEFK